MMPHRQRQYVKPDLAQIGGCLPAKDTEPVVLMLGSDGMSWLTDGNNRRLLRFDASGSHLNTIDLADQVARTIFDLEGYDGMLWVS